jgi:hypothetical protein
VTHPYTRVSAGIRCLHLLCHNLNLRGYSAYLIFIGDTDDIKEDATEPDLLTPILTRRVARRHFETQRTPIMVYPEIVGGNPHQSPCVVRYVLNFPGLLGGDKTYAEDDLCFGYSKKLAEFINRPENILFIPASDTSVFYPPENETKREGSCFYASKYQREHKGALFDITKNSVEITSRMPNSQSPSEIAELFRKSDIFYTYENTALAIEATLCGCPTVFLPNSHLDAIIAGEELGSDGYAWGTAPEEINRARASVGKAVENYKNALKLFEKNLDKFIEKTQSYSKNRAYTHKQFLSLCDHLPSSLFYDGIVGEVGIKERTYSKILSKLPWRVERQIGALLCSLGLMNDGEFLWNRATRRGRKEK